ncbi:hypothetical protein QQ73_20900 [Candidatus Endoriftia persephone str. Guaymas]|nr:hypothetical protein [Candidatus Endoriftia persephone str. Guaymas]
MEAPVELVNLRVGLQGPSPQVALKAVPAAAALAEWESIRVAGVEAEVPCYERAELLAGCEVVGPALVTEQVSTSWIAPGWRCRVDGVGNLLLSQT